MIDFQKNGELDIKHLLDLFQKLNLVLNPKLQKCMNITKKEGVIIKDKYEKGEITGKNFEEWIDSTKIRK